MPFEKPCAWIDYYDTIWLEWRSTKDYDDWVRRKLSNAKKDDSRSQERFWEKLRKDLEVDLRSTEEEADERFDRTLYPTSPTAGLSVGSDLDEEVVDQDSFPSELQKSNHDNSGSESKCGGYATAEGSSYSLRPSE